MFKISKTKRTGLKKSSTIFKFKISKSKSGLRGHELENPDKVQFKNKRGEPVEFEEIGTIVKTARKGRRMYRKRTRRVKKAG